MKTPIDILQSQLAFLKALQAEEDNKASRDQLAQISKSATDNLNNLIDKYSETLTPQTDTPTRKVKSRGIALCHKDQGYSANNRAVSLLEKSADGKARVTINKAAGRTLKATKGIK